MMDIQNEIVQIAQTYSPGATESTSASSIESLEFWEFILEVEEKFKIDFDDENLTKCKTLGDIASLISDLVV